MDDILCEAENNAETDDAVKSNDKSPTSEESFGKTKPLDDTNNSNNMSAKGLSCLITFFSV